MAFVTSGCCIEQFDQNVREDLAADALEKLGFLVKFCFWDDLKIRWQSYDYIVIRTTWDYHLRYTEFSEWLKRIASLGKTIMNPADVIMKNAHKSYLSTLTGHGLPVPPTVYISQRRSSFPALSGIMKEQGWEQAVVKPSVSANGYKTTHIPNLEDAAHPDCQHEFDLLLEERDVMVQQYLPAIMHQGEWSLVYFNRTFSHAVVKLPTGKDFRCCAVDNDHILKKNPSAEMLAVASNALSKIDGQLLFSRVDMVEEDNGKIWLMEIELIEPQLFFDCYADTATNFAKAFNVLINTF